MDYTRKQMEDIAGHNLKVITAGWLQREEVKMITITDNMTFKELKEAIIYELSRIRGMGGKDRAYVKLNECLAALEDLENNRL